MIPDCIVIGGGGHARVVIDALRASGLGTPRAVVDAAADRRGQRVDGVEIVGGDAELPALKAQGITHFVMGICGAGSNQPRRKLFEAALAQGLQPLTVVHPSAVVSKAATLAEGVQVLARAVINPGAVIGVNVVINTGAIVEHDCVITCHAHVASGAVLAGGVRVEEGAHIGAGSVTRQGCVIGAGAIVGAGASVVEDVPANVVVVGVPAVILKPC
jgi:sugar O-acyltransferase (sialic acid O-acetyltransferase NeuD family)